MFRRGLTVVAWLVGLAAVTYEDVVQPIAHAAFGARVTQERVHEAEPGAIQNDSFAARVAPALKDKLNWGAGSEQPEDRAWEIDVAQATVSAQAMAAHAMAAQRVAARKMAARAAVAACDEWKSLVEEGLEGWL